MNPHQPRQFSAIATLVIVCATSLMQTAMADNVPNRIFELRTYSVSEQEAQKLHGLFEANSGRFFIKYGIQVIALWTPHEADNPRRQLVCLLAHSSKHKAGAAWQAFDNDPKWLKLVAEAGVDASSLKPVESVFFDPTHYSPLK